jgi:hypothetical protein
VGDLAESSPLPMMPHVKKFTPVEPGYTAELPDNAVWTEDVSIPDGTVFSSNKSFTKT